jgi:hypothetical protein
VFATASASVLPSERVTLSMLFHTGPKRSKNVAPDADASVDSGDEAAAACDVRSGEDPFFASGFSDTAGTGETGDAEGSKKGLLLLAICVAAAAAVCVARVLTGAPGATVGDANTLLTTAMMLAKNAATACI